MYSHWASSALNHYLRARAYLLLYIWVFIIVWLTVRYSLSGLFTLGTIIPVYLYVKYIDIRQPFEFLKLDKKNLISGYLWGIVLAASFAAILIMKVHYWGQGNIYYDWPMMDVVNIVIIASLVEEIFFRGFLLQKFMEATSFAKANIMVTLLFVTLHFPVWISDGLNALEIGESLVYLTGFSWVLGYVFNCSNSLWTPIILHAANNFFKLATISIQYLNSSSF
ncbi:CAAX amino protease [Sporomusaceae bacterium FL31]|nr:CAAX amino protease [Sporomusaceae bacterium FL31]GCE34152.1 CAAX amino protease [Sporomusaceae bacterium]